MSIGKLDRLEAGKKEAVIQIQPRSEESHQWRERKEKFWGNIISRLGHSITLGQAGHERHTHKNLTQES